MKYILKPQVKQALRPKTQSSTNHKSVTLEECYYDSDRFPSYVEVPESSATPTGLFDIHGNEYQRVNDAIGFFDPEQL